MNTDRDQDVESLTRRGAARRLEWMIMSFLTQRFGIRVHPCSSVVVFFLLALAFLGFTSPSSEPRKLRFAFIPKALHIPVFAYAKTGAERMAQQLGGIEIIWRGAETTDEIRQKEILESFIAQRVD